MKTVYFAFYLAIFVGNEWREPRPSSSRSVGGLQRSCTKRSTSASIVRVHLLPSAAGAVLIGVPLKRIIPKRNAMQHIPAVHTADILIAHPPPGPRITSMTIGRLYLTRMCAPFRGIASLAE